MLEHGLAILIFLGRAGDVLSTLYVSPNMLLEMNPLARRFKWPTMMLGFGLCAIPYFDVHLAVIVAVPSLLVTASNLSKSWMARVLGDQEMERIVLRAAASASLPITVLVCWISAVFIFLTAGMLLWINQGNDSMVSSFAMGVSVYGLALAVHGTFYYVRVFRRSRLEGRQ